MGNCARNAGTLTRQSWDELNIFKKFKCEICDARFRQQEYLMQHQQLYHSNKAYDCKMCNQEFPSMEAMRTHMQRMHSYNGKRNY